MSKVKRIEDIPPLRDALVQYNNFGYSNMGSDYSITTLITPPKIVQLRRRYADEISEQPLDLSKSLASFKGTAIHNELEKNLWKAINKGVNPDYILEKRLWDRICDRKISGQFDVLLRDQLYDWKTTSVFKAVKKDFTAWEEQLNMYMYMLSIIGRQVNELFIIPLYSDWSKSKMYEDNYPRQPFDLISLKKWTLKQAKEFMCAKIEAQKAAEDVPDEELPQCTAKDMWEKPTMWALYEYTEAGAVRKRASRVMDSKQGVIDWAEWKGLKKSEYELQVRPGSRVRCDEWCDCSIVCDQYNEYMEVA